MFWVIGLFHITVRDIGCLWNTSLTLCFIDSSDCAAGALGEQLVDPVFDTSNIVVRTVEVNGIKVISNSDISNSIFQKSEVDI